MTKQIPDKVLYKGQEYILAGLKGTRLFSPLDFGISSEMMGVMTACYRRYFCTYSCIDNELFLSELVLVHHQRDDVEIELPAIEGVIPKPVPPESDIIIFNCYQELKIPCSFSGGLILVRNPVELVSDYPSPIEFEEVVEVLFEKGKMQQGLDHSATVARLRKQVDGVSETLKSNSEMAEVLRKWDSPDEKVSDPETKLFDEYINEIVDKTIEIEWSFVSDYEQQPPR
jgi:hypothetical protein